MKGSLVKDISNTSCLFRFISIFVVVEVVKSPFEGLENIYKVFHTSLFVFGNSMSSCTGILFYFLQKCLFCDCILFQYVLYLG